MLRYYQVDLARDLGTERLSYRRLRVLLTNLPRESSYVQAVGGDIVRWGTVEHLLANLIDSVTMLNHNFVQSKSKSRLPKATLMERPGVKPAGTSRKLPANQYSLAEMRKILDEWSG